MGTHLFGSPCTTKESLELRIVLSLPTRPCW